MLLLGCPAHTLPRCTAEGFDTCLHLGGVDDSLLHETPGATTPRHPDGSQDGAVVHVNTTPAAPTPVASPSYLCGDCGGILRSVPLRALVVECLADDPDAHLCGCHPGEGG
jgi:hypothetical protein